MDFKATLSDITVNFTPDEWEAVKRMGDFSVAHIEEINQNAIEEESDRLPQLYASMEQFIPCACGLVYKRRQWKNSDCKAKHPEHFTVAPKDK